MKEQKISNDPWKNFDTASEEIIRTKEKVNYLKMIDSNKIIFLGDIHSDRSIREHIAKNAENMKSAGITHYAIEANEAGNEVFSQLSNGQNVDLSNVDVGPGRNDYEQAIRALSKHGIKIVAIDIDQSTKPTKEERESHLLENITQIFIDDPDAKIAVLIGEFHTTRKKTGEVPYLGNRLTSIDFPTTNIRFTGKKNQAPKLITDSTKKAGLESEEFSLDFRKYKNSEYIPYGEGEADWVIHLPQR